MFPYKGRPGSKGGSRGFFGRRSILRVLTTWGRFRYRSGNVMRSVVVHIPSIHPPHGGPVSCDQDHPFFTRETIKEQWSLIPCRAAWSEVERPGKPRQSRLACRIGRERHCRDQWVREASLSSTPSRGRAAIVGSGRISRFSASFSCVRVQSPNQNSSMMRAPELRREPNEINRPVILSRKRRRCSGPKLRPDKTIKDALELVLNMCRRTGNSKSWGRQPTWNAAALEAGPTRAIIPLPPACSGKTSKSIGVLVSLAALACLFLGSGLPCCAHQR